ncbi:DUF4388 domain-containing protein [Actinoplanes sp. NPDC051411]|uniref:DUF4388 domain-containing protein n=1 Tax=Actinoplanes sp. NPDC051411 TaxID=3155522 RepID=UPI0034478C8C
MSSSKAPADLLTRAAGERWTGALVVGGQPGGTVYLVEGRVVHAESPAAPGVGELLTSSGRLAARTWQNALDLGTSTARVGRLLIEQGHLTQGELELCVLGAIYDAAYFVLAPDEAPVEFLEGAAHWLGPIVHIDPAAVTRETRRRVRLLDEIFPDRRVDTAAVSPVSRPPRERIWLTAGQWELLVAADGQRTPADLAQLLGRAGFATIQELRRLAAHGLLELPEVRAEAPEFVRLPRAGGTAVDVKRPAVRMDDPPVPVVSATVPVTPPPGEPGVNEGAFRPPRLARRKPGAKLPKDLAAEPPPVHTGTDEVLLKRIRTALRALR